MKTLLSILTAWLALVSAHAAASNPKVAGTTVPASDGGTGTNMAFAGTTITSNVLGSGARWTNYIAAISTNLTGTNWVMDYDGKRHGTGMLTNDVSLGVTNTPATEQRIMRVDIVASGTNSVTIATNIFVTGIDGLVSATNVFTPPEGSWIIFLDASGGTNIADLTWMGYQKDNEQDSRIADLESEDDNIHVDLANKSNLDHTHTESGDFSGGYTSSSAAAAVLYSYTFPDTNRAVSLQVHIDVAGPTNSFYMDSRARGKTTTSLTAILTGYTNLVSIPTGVTNVVWTVTTSNLNLVAYGYAGETNNWVWQGRIFGNTNGFALDSAYSYTANLLGYWQFEENNLTRVDEVGTSDALSQNGAVPNVTGFINNAADLRAANGYLTRADNASFSAPSAMTVSLLVYPRALGVGAFQTFMAHWNPSGTMRAWSINASTANLLRAQFSTDGSTIARTLNSTFTYSTNTWYHIVAVADGTDAFLYINGTLEASGTLTTPLNDSSTSLTVGADGAGNNECDAYIDEPALWIGRALSAAEIANLYTRYQSLLGYPLP